MFNCVGHTGEPYKRINWDTVCCTRRGCVLAPPGEYDESICAAMRAVATITVATISITSMRNNRYGMCWLHHRHRPFYSWQRRIRGQCESWRRVCDTTSLSVSVAYRLLGSASHANISGPSTYIGCSKTDWLVSTELNKLASLPLRLIVKETATWASSNC